MRVKNRFRWIEMKKFSERVRDTLGYGRRPLRQEKAIAWVEKRLLKSTDIHDRKVQERRLRKYRKLLKGALQRREDRTLELTIAATKDLLESLEARLRERQPDHADPLTQYVTFMDRVRRRAFGVKKAS